MEATATHPRILVVDDEEKIVSLLKRQMENAGFEVQTATRGADALDAVHQQKPDIMVLDLRMPDMSGNQVCWIIRQVYDAKRLPIVILTAAELGAEELRQQAHGANAYLNKPCEFSEVLQTVRSLLA
jgi:DNA-binding response OmpR family regulator